MLRSKIPGKKIIFLAAIVLCTFLGADVQKVKATESGCVTCHLDKEMLKKNIVVKKGVKSAMQSGAG